MSVASSDNVPPATRFSGVLYCIATFLVIFDGDESLVEVVYLGLGTFGFLYGAFDGDLGTPFFSTVTTVFFSEAAFTFPDEVLLSVLAVAPADFIAPALGFDDGLYSPSAGFPT